MFLGQKSEGLLRRDEENQKKPQAVRMTRQKLRIEEDLCAD